MISPRGRIRAPDPANGTNASARRITRRDALHIGGAALSLGGLSATYAHLTGGRLTPFSTPASAASTPRMVDDVLGHGVRKSAHALTADSDDVAMYREAVGWMKARSLGAPLDPMGWAQHWAHHSLFCATATFEYQIHYGWNFLPWHRAYMFVLEQKIRRVLNEPAFALPYWDWTASPQIPSWYFGTDNPLANATRIQEAHDVIPADFIEAGPAMRAVRWEHFGGRPRERGNWQVEGTLEESIHNCVHNWTGGEMASFDGAGNDPLFQSHHGQVDRLWEAWRAQEGRANLDSTAWRDTAFWFYGWRGVPQEITVGELLDLDRLGYGFDDLSWRHTLTPETTPVFEEAVAEAADAMPAHAAAAAAPVGLGALRIDESQRARIEDVREAKAQDLAAGRPSTARVSLNYDRLTLPNHPFHHRLFFVDRDDGDAATYVGTFTILPIPDQTAGLEDTVTSQVEVPPAALAMLTEAHRVAVVGVPVPLKGRTIPMQPVPFNDVSLTVEL